MREQSEGGRWDRDTRGRKCEVYPQDIKKRSKKRHLLYREGGREREKKETGDIQFVALRDTRNHNSLAISATGEIHPVAIGGYSLVLASAHRITYGLLSRVISRDTEISRAISPLFNGVSY